MNEPEKRFKAGQVEASIWANKVSKNGYEFDSKSINIQRIYKATENGKDVWKRTPSFHRNDLPNVILVANEALKYLALKTQETKTSDKEMRISTELVHDHD